MVQYRHYNNYRYLTVLFYNLGNGSKQIYRLLDH